MAHFDTGDWIGLAQVRKAVRDEVREAFWAAIGVDPHATTQTVTYAPQDQRVSIIGLLKVVRDTGVDAQHGAFLVTMARSLAAVGFGKGAMGGTSANLASLSAFHTRPLDEFFLMRYKFEGPRGPDGPA